MWLYILTNCKQFNIIQLIYFIQLNGQWSRIMILLSVPQEKELISMHNKL